MSVGYDESLNDLDVGSPTPITLAVGWTVGKNTKIRQVLLGNDVSAEFRRIAKNTLEDLKEREPAEWTPDADLSPETFLILDADEVGEAPRLTSDHDGKRFLDALSQAERLEAINPKHLPTGDVSFYALVFGAPDDRTVFIRRSNPRRGLKRGRIYSVLSDTLQTLEEPIFAFDEWFDLVLHRDKVMVLSQTVFAAFFRDQETLAKKIPEWIGQLAEHVPLASSSRDCLTERVSKDSRLKARLEAIVRREHLASVTTETLRTAMEDNELDPSTLLDEDGNLTLTTEDVPQVLYLLNEDLFTGSLTSTGFRADKKAAR
ncbi:hypothetical protein [Nesterenkonia lutea]|uniref:DUF4868 domain-containing protein n=1 Tax=Nesterenkonia lutea TaxID=272919 RepID=A0ABR9JEE2_9MICC|nr:hypothetical protein [Nesterenkonia lutea]MBE1524290.1 hypothetical protein [Nesterenkonia lutea]